MLKFLPCIQKTVLHHLRCFLLSLPLKELDLGSSEDFITLLNHFDHFSEKSHGSMKYARGLLISMFWEFFRYYVKVKRNVTDKNHPDNYWVSNLIDGKVKCYHFEINVCICCSLKANEEKFNGVTMSKKKGKTKRKAKWNYMDICCYSLTFHFYIKTWMTLSTWLMERGQLNKQSMNFPFTTKQAKQNML